MKLQKRLNLPKEHGAWAMLYVPFALGWLVAGRGLVPVLLLLGATSAIFISRESLLVWWRARRRNRPAETAWRLLLAYAGVALLCGAPLLLAYRFWGLAPMALAGAGLLLLNGSQGAQLEERSIRNEMLAIAGLTMTAPAAYYVARGAWDATALWLWLFCILYFASSVFYVKLRVSRLHAKTPGLARQVWRYCLGYHLSLVAGLALLVGTGSLSLLALVAFAPILARAGWALVRPATGRLDLRRAGWMEMGYSLFFLLTLTLTFH